MWTGSCQKVHLEVLDVPDGPLRTGDVETTVTLTVVVMSTMVVVAATVPTVFGPNLTSAAFEGEGDDDDDDASASFAIQSSLTNVTDSPKIKREGVGGRGFQGGRNRKGRRFNGINDKIG